MQKRAEQNTNININIKEGKKETNSADKHCIPTHFLNDLTFRMLVNIHFQK